MLSGDGVIRKLSPSGQLLASWGGHGSGLGQFLIPSGIAVGPSGAVYVTDAFTGTVTVFPLDGQATVLSGLHLNHPEGLAVDQNGLYVADTGNARVVVLNLDGRQRAIAGSRGTGQGQLMTPTDVAVTPSGQIYVADFEGARVVEFSATGQFIQQWDRQGIEPGEFFGPNAIGADARGNVYVLENSSTNHRIQKLTQATNGAGTETSN